MFFTHTRYTLPLIVMALLTVGVLFAMPGELRAQSTDTLLAQSQVGTQTTTSDVELHSTATEPVMYVFHSRTCPHCRKLMAFLEKVGPLYPDLEIRAYEMSDKTHQQLMTDLAKQYGAERYLGMVPLVFVGSRYFVGYESDTTTGADIVSEVEKLVGAPSQQTPGNDDVSSPEPTHEITDPAGAQDTPGTGTAHPIRVLFLGEIDPSRYSLPILAILLGFLDGFNVCSLGALFLIIGLTLKLQRRRAIILFGGAFIVTTALVYGLLMELWYRLFVSFSAYTTALTLTVALLSIGAAAYFFKEYFRMLKQGAVCELQESPWIRKLSEHTGRAFEDTSKLLTIFGAVVAFAAVVAIVEFPCSAGVPVSFAGILANNALTGLTHYGYLALFLLFYLLDELLVFGIAAYKLKIWMMNGTFTKWAVLGEAVILLGIGFYYLATMFGLI